MTKPQDLAHDDPTDFGISPPPDSKPTPRPEATPKEAKPRPVCRCTDAEHTKSIEVLPEYIHSV